MFIEIDNTLINTKYITSIKIMNDKLIRLCYNNSFIMIKSEIWMETIEKYDYIKDCIKSLGIIEINLKR